jgi:hypothetical protein
MLEEVSQAIRLDSGFLICGSKEAKKHSQTPAIDSVIPEDFQMHDG